METIDPREIQMLQAYLEEFGQQIEIYSRQLQMLEQRRLESLVAIETLGAIGKTPGEPLLLELGGGVSLRVNLIDPDKVLVNIGSDVIVERTNEESAQFLNDRAKEMEALGKKVADTIAQLQNQANEVARRYEQAYQQAQKQYSASQKAGF
jgi:prefoldin alpha subunit